MRPVESNRPLSDGSVATLGDVQKWRGLYPRRCRMSANFYPARTIPGDQAGIRFRLPLEPGSGEKTMFSRYAFDEAGAKGETRTLTSLKIPEPKSGASTNSATFAVVSCLPDYRTPHRIPLRGAGPETGGACIAGAGCMGWTMGIEPTTTRITILHSTN